MDQEQAVAPHERVQTSGDVLLKRRLSIGMKAERTQAAVCDLAVKR